MNFSFVALFLLTMQLQKHKSDVESHLLFTAKIISVNGDTVHIETKFTNIGTDTINYRQWTCFKNYESRVDNANCKLVQPTRCTKNIFEYLMIAPGEIETRVVAVVLSPKFHKSGSSFRICHDITFVQESDTAPYLIARYTEETKSFWSENLEVFR